MYLFFIFCTYYSIIICTNREPGVDVDAFTFTFTFTKNHDFYLVSLESHPDFHLQ